MGAKRAMPRPSPRRCPGCGALNKNCPRRLVDVAAYLPLVKKLARRMARRLPAHVEVDDLISAGVMGLLDAAERFDPKLIDRFEGFAEFRIRGAMIDDIRSRDTLSRDMRKQATQLKKTARALEGKLGRTPELEEIAKAMGVTLDELYAIQGKLSGSSVVGIDDAGPDLLERVPDTQALDPLEAAARRQEMARLLVCVEQLPANMKRVLGLYYVEGLTFKQIGSVMGFTLSRACQIHSEAAARLRVTCAHLGAA